MKTACMKCTVCVCVCVCSVSTRETQLVGLSESTFNEVMFFYLPIAGCQRCIITGNRCSLHFYD